VLTKTDRDLAGNAVVPPAKMICYRPAFMEPANKHVTQCILCSDVFSVACHDRRYDDVCIFLSGSSRSECTHEIFRYTWSPLHSAVGHGWTDVTKALVDLGVSVNSANNIGETVLHCAAYSGNLAIAEYLIDKGAIIKTKAKNGYDAIDWARMQGNPEMVTLLLTRSFGQATI
jgi:ankyrin repeat protein